MSEVKNKIFVRTSGDIFISLCRYNRAYNLLLTTFS